MLFSTCVQPALAPEINQQTKYVLSKINVVVEETTQAMCCGAVDQHLDAQEKAETKSKANIDQWYDKLTKGGFSVIVSSGSGCGAMIKDYGLMFA